MKQSLTIQDVDQLDPLVNMVKSLAVEHQVFCFHGDLGAGKTTYIKGLCRAWGVSSATSSPTFSVVNEYQTKDGQRILHFDIYRLKHPEELIDIGWYDYLNSDDIILLEWPEQAPEMMPDDAVHIYIEVQADQSRVITIQTTTYEPI